jgi:hypothetical protein
MNEHIRQDPPAPRGDEATDTVGVMDPPQQEPRADGTTDTVGVMDPPQQEPRADGTTDTVGVMDPPQQKPSDVMPDNRAAIDVAATDVMAPPAERPETD